MLEKFKHINVDYTQSTGKELVFIDLKLGNICNLKCRICGSWSLTKWAKEELDYETDNKDLIARTHMCRTMALRERTVLGKYG